MNLKIFLSKFRAISAEIVSLPDFQVRTHDQA